MITTQTYIRMDIQCFLQGGFYNPNKILIQVVSSTHNIHEKEKEQF